jgi:hypothetical protein
MGEAGCQPLPSAVGRQDHRIAGELLLGRRNRKMAIDPGTLQDQHIRLLVVRAMSDVRDLMSRDGATAAIGADSVYPTVRDAVASRP